MTVKFLIKAGASFCIKIGAQILALLTAMLLTRILSVEEYGVYALVISSLTLISLLITAGSPDVITRFCSTYLAKERWGHLRGIIRTALIYPLVIGTVIALVGCAVLYIIGHDSGESSYIGGLGVILFIIPFMGLLACIHGMMRGLHHVIWAQLPTFIIQPAIMVGLCAAVFLSILDINVSTAAQALQFYVISICLAAVMAVVILLFNAPKSIRSENCRFEFAIWGRSFLPLVLSAGMIEINNNADILMLGAFRGGEDAGLYQAATRTASIVVLVLSAVNAVSAPLLAKFHAENDYSQMQKLLKYSAWIITLLTLPLILFITFFSGFIMQLLFGDSYAVAGDAFMLLSWGQGFNALAGSVGYVLIMTGNQKLTFYGVLMATIINVSLNFILIPLYGLNGAAVATGLSIIVWNALLSFWVAQRLGLNCTVFPFWGRKHG